MKTARLQFIVALLAGLVASPTLVSAAESAASAPAQAVAPAASSPDKPGKRPATPQENRDSATTPGDLRPDARVTPQLSIPLNPSGAGKPTYVRPPRGKPAPSGGIDDSAARCKAMADAQARQDCLGKLH